jgi:hypothetical protein
MKYAGYERRIAYKIFGEKIAEKGPFTRHALMRG